MIRAIEAAAVRAVAAWVRRWPMDVVRRRGAAVGRFAYAVDRRHRTIALTNLAASLPGRTEAEHREVARAMFAHFGSLLFELLKFDSYTPEQMRAAVDVEGAERVREAYARGRGVLFFTGHFGYWEIQALVQPLVMEPVAVLARPLDNPVLDRMLLDIRTRTGNTVINRQGAVRKVLRELQANRAVALLIDQHLHTPDAVYVQFFGRPAATTSALAALALRTGAAVVPVFSLPIEGGRYKLVFESPVAPPATDSADAVGEFTQRCTDVLEMYVRRHPEQWLWMHRRWREERVG